MSLVDSIIGAESGGDSNAKNPNSSASGPGQFVDSTWLDVARKVRPDLADKSDSEVLALKSDPQLSRQATDYYAQQNQAVLAKNGLPVTPGTTYLAHFAGPQGAIGLLHADPSTPAGAVLGSSVVRSNPFLAKMTAGDVAAWANRKMGVASPTAPFSFAGPLPALGSAPASPTPSQPPAQNNAPVNSAVAPAQQSSPFDPSALAAVPRLTNILPKRPNPFGLSIAPFSLGG
jgi:hypothetical protein